jgi:hypothetical protein
MTTHKNFIELGDHRIYDCGKDKGYSICKWIPESKDNDMVGDWKEVFHSSGTKSLVSYLHKIHKKIKDEDNKEN